MLGARARAAEYNAAKAAAARQEANRVREAEENQSPPTHPAVSLYSFAKSSARNRNKDQKISKPLGMSDEDEENTENIDPNAGSPKSLSPLPESISLPARPASLPPPQTLDGMMADPEKDTQTPFRYKAGQYTSFDTRKFFHEDVPRYLPQAAIDPHFTRYTHHLPVPHQVTQYQHHGHYYHQDSYGQEVFHQSPNTRAPTPNLLSYVSQSSFLHSDKQFSNPEANKRVFESIYDSPRPSQIDPQNMESDFVSETPEEEEPYEIRYVFGPDDIPPSKMEVKEAHRRNLFGPEEQSPRLSQSTTGTQSHRKPFPRSFESPVIKKPTGNGSAPSREEEVDDKQTRFKDPCSVDPERLNLVLCFPKTEGEWPCLGTDADAYKHSVEEVADEVVVRRGGQSEVNRGEKESCISQVDKVDDEPPAPYLRPPPGLVHPALNGQKSDYPAQETSPDIKHPCTDVHSDSWLEVRLPTVEEREFMRERMLSSWDTRIDEPPARNQNREWWIREMESRKELEKILDQTKQAQIHRNIRISELAQEMQNKWEYGGEFRSATMTAKEAKKNAATVKAVTSILSTLNSAPVDEHGLPRLGSRPYCHPSNYPVSRSNNFNPDNSAIDIVKKGPLKNDERRLNNIPHRLEASREVKEPARLARDPRFRQFDEDWKPRGYEPKVSRFFGPNGRF